MKKFHVYAGSTRIGSNFASKKAAVDFLNQIDINIDPDSKYAKQFSVKNQARIMGKATIKKLANLNDVC